MQTQPEAVQPGDQSLNALAETYDEHEVRMATYLGEELGHEQRINLGVEGLTKVATSRRWSIDDFQAASEAMEQSLKSGETVGRAIVAGLRAVNRGG